MLDAKWLLSILTVVERRTTGLGVAVGEELGLRMTVGELVLGHCVGARSCRPK